MERHVISNIFTNLYNYIDFLLKMWYNTYVRELIKYQHTFSKQRAFECGVGIFLQTYRQTRKYVKLINSSKMLVRS